MGCLITQARPSTIYHIPSTLKIHRNLLHVLIHCYMLFLRKILRSAAEAEDAGDAEVAVVLFEMAPADEVPVECVKDQTDGFGLAFGYFFLQVGILYFQHPPLGDGLLDGGQVFCVLNKTGRRLELDIAG